MLASAVAALVLINQAYAFKGDTSHAEKVQIAVYRHVLPYQVHVIRAVMQPREVELKYVDNESPNTVTAFADALLQDALLQEQAHIALYAHGGPDRGWKKDGSLHYSNPTHSFQNYVFAHPNTPAIKSVEGLTNKTVLTWYNGDKDMGGEYEQMVKDGLIAVEYIKVEDIVKSFADPDALVIWDIGMFYDQFQQAGLSGHTMSRRNAVFPDTYHFPSACRKKEDCDSINAGLKEVCQSGKLDQIYASYGIVNSKTVCALAVNQ